MWGSNAKFERKRKFPLPLPTLLAAIGFLSDRHARRTWVNEDPYCRGGWWWLGISSNPWVQVPEQWRDSGPQEHTSLSSNMRMPLRGQSDLWVLWGFVGAIRGSLGVIQSCPLRFLPGTVFSASQRPSGHCLQLWPLQANSTTEASESFQWGLKVRAALGPECIFLISWLFSPNIFICRWNDSKMNIKALL